jgi:hypothetical protein
MRLAPEGFLDPRLDRFVITTHSPLHSLGLAVLPG